MKTPKTIQEAELAGLRRSTPEEIRKSKDLGGQNIQNAPVGGNCYVGSCGADGYRTVCYYTDEGHCENCYQERCPS